MIISIVFVILFLNILLNLHIRLQLFIRGKNLFILIKQREKKYTLFLVNSRKVGHLPVSGMLLKSLSAYKRLICIQNGKKEKHFYGKCLFKIVLNVTSSLIAFFFFFPLLLRIVLELLQKAYLLILDIVLAKLRKRIALRFRYSHRIMLLVCMFQYTK